MTYSLNGSDWTLIGRIPNQMQKTTSMELNIHTDPIVGPIKAAVPGAVQADLLKEGLIDNPYYGRNCEHSEWVNNREWQFRKSFVLNEELKSRQRFILSFEALDFCGEIYLNSKKIADFADMFVPIHADVTTEINIGGENILDVVFRKSPEVDCQFGYTSRTKKFKSRFNYFWDWSPRMIPVGICGNVSLKGYNSGCIEDLYPKAEGETVSANVSFHSLTGGDYTFTYTVCKKGTNTPKIVAFKERLRAGAHTIIHEITVENPALWYPNCQGEQPLYTLTLTVDEGGKPCDTAEKNFGFRCIKFIQNDNAPAGALPYTMVINGQKTFIKGVNWVPLSMYYGTVTRADYFGCVKRFKDMNCNLLRVWGGGILEKSDFYDACDALGIMVWQEFPQSSSGIDNLPPGDDPDVMSNLQDIAAHFIKGRRHHPSHVIWCGGNELMHDGCIPVDLTHRNIKMLADLVKTLDNGKCFLPSSASGPSFCADKKNFGKGLHHDVHGPWKYLGEEEQYTFFNGDDSLFRSETGCPGAASFDAIKKYSNGMSLWPPIKENRYWGFPSTWWILYDEMQALFGAFPSEKSLKTYIDSTRLLQAEALRYAAEATIRRTGEASGFILWMGNEPYPNPCNTSVLEFDGNTPKPAYYPLRNAFAPLTASLKYNKINYKEGEPFEAELYTYSEKETTATITLTVTDGSGQVFFKETYKDSPLKGSKQLVNISCIPHPKSGIFFARITLNGKVQNTYTFTVGASGYKALRELPAATLACEKTARGTRIRNTSSTPAVGVFVKADGYGSLSDGFFTLFAHEEITVESEEDTPLKIDGYNVKGAQ